MTGPADQSRQPDGAQVLRLESTIDAADMTRLAGAIKAALLAQDLTNNERWMAPVLGFRWLGISTPKRAVIVRWLSVAGLATALLLALLGGVEWRGQRLELVFASFFAAALLMSFIVQPLVSWARKPWLPFWAYLARVRADRMLKKARASVPFVARYEFEGDTVVYFRTIGAHAELVWKRRLHGVRVSGPGFTLLYKDASALNPFAILLHQPSAEFDALLERLGVQPMPLT